MGWWKGKKKNLKGNRLENLNEKLYKKKDDMEEKNIKKGLNIRKEGN